MKLNDPRWKTAQRYDPSDVPDGPDLRAGMTDAVETTRGEIQYMYAEALRQLEPKVERYLAGFVDGLYESKMSPKVPRLMGNLEEAIGDAKLKLEDIQDLVSNHVINAFEGALKVAGKFPTH